jgi:cellulose synthase (UDP-forming)
MSFALFPTWIAASLAGASAALFGRHLTFSVTAKTKQDQSGSYRLVLPQLVAMGGLLVASGIGTYRVLHHDASALLTGLSMVWVVVDLALLGVVIGAWRYRGPGPEVVSPVAVDAYIDEPARQAHEPHEAYGTADPEALDRPDRPLAVVTESERELLEVVQRNAGEDGTRVTSFRLAENRFDAAEALRLRVQVAAALSEGRDLVLLDVSAVSVITSSGVAALFDLLRLVRSRGGDLRLYGASAAFRAAHAAHRLESVLRVYDAEPDAARSTASV